METALKITALLAGAYALLVAVIALSQTALLFPRWAVAPTPPPPLPTDAVPIQLDRPNGVVLHGHLLATGEGGAPIVGFGGNAWNAADVALFLHRIFPDHPIAVFHYRGYAPSTGDLRPRRWPMTRWRSTTIWANRRCGKSRLW